MRRIVRALLVLLILAMLTSVCMPSRVRGYVPESVAAAFTPAPVSTPEPTAAPTPTPTPAPTPTPVPDDHVVYLTFDDGPSEYTETLLDVLDKYGVKATFFVVDTGRYDVLEDEYRRGHTIGVHSASHNYGKIYASESAYWDDFYKMAEIIYEHTGQWPELLRFPGGSSNTVSGFDAGIMSRLTKQVQEQGYEYFDWNVLSGDAGETTDTEQVVKNVIEGIQQNNKSIVLQHDSKDFSVAAVEQIIVWGQENGYTFLPLTKDSFAAHHAVAN